MNIIENFRQFLLSEVAPDFNRKNLNPDDELIELGLIDSLGIMKLVTFMEEEFGITVLDEEIVPENFQCLNSLVSFVEGKR